MQKSLQIKQQLLEVISKYEDFSQKIEEIEKIEATPIDVKVAFLGEFSSGKSSLINSLLKKPILPAFDKPTNAVITEIKKGEEDEISMIYQDENGDTVSKQIEFYQLGDEVMKYEDNKKILLELKDVDFLDEQTVLIDTPGVASINEMHTDVTFGYLPFVDAAFVLMNLNIGAPSKTFIEFLKKFPQDFLNKLYFILTFKDTKTETEIEEIKGYFVESLSPLFENLKILIVSSKDAMENIENYAEYEKSGVLDIKNIISSEIPKYKEEIEEKRMREAYILKTKETIELLKYKMEAIDYNDDSFDSEISKLKKEIVSFKEGINNIESKFSEIKDDSISSIKSIIKDNSELIAHLAAQNQDCSGVVSNMVDDIKNELESKIKKIQGLELKGISENIGGIISSRIEKTATKTANTATAITDFATIALGALLIPPAAAGAAGAAGVTAAKHTLKGSTKQAIKQVGKTVVKEATQPQVIVNVIGKCIDAIGSSEKDKGSDSDLVSESVGEQKATGNASEQDSKPAKQSDTNDLTKSQKVLGAIGNFIKDANPLEKIKDMVLPRVMDNKLNYEIQKGVSKTIGVAFDVLEDSLNNIINNDYLLPLKNKQSILEEIQKKKQDAYFEKEKFEEQLKSDITKLNLLITKV